VSTGTYRTARQADRAVKYGNEVRGRRLDSRARDLEGVSIDAHRTRSNVRSNVQ
jgi:hypothetical protein